MLRKAGMSGSKGAVGKGSAQLTPRRRPTLRHARCGERSDGSAESPTPRPGPTFTTVALGGQRHSPAWKMLHHVLLRASKWPVPVNGLPALACVSVVGLTGFAADTPPAARSRGRR